MEDIGTVAYVRRQPGADSLAALVKLRVHCLAVIALVLAGCQPPARQFVGNCEPACLTNGSVRLDTRDVLVTAPGIWKFIDEVGAQLAPACIPDGGALESGLTPLWRRAIVGPMPWYQDSSSARAMRGRGALAVHPTGGIAVAIDGAVWLIDPQTGTPRHVMTGVVIEGRYLTFDEPVAAFTPDGRRLWTGGHGPVLLDLERYDRRFGFTVDYSWRDAHREGMYADLWEWPSQSVGSDGTLYWMSQFGVIRALEPSGTVRWERSDFGGDSVALVTVDDQDVSWWGWPGAALSRNGELVWQPVRLSTADDPAFLNLEGSPLGDLLTVQHSEPRGVALHRRDGSFVGSIPVDFADSSASRDTTVLLAKDEELSAWSTVSQQRLWATRLGGSISAGPVLSRETGNAWVVTDDCRVSEVDRAGVVRRWHQMSGRPTDQIARISNGVLYVLSMVDNRLLPDEELRPGSISLPDGGPTRAVDYDCYANHPYLCGLTVRPGAVFFLYAYRIE